jgi:hypothetical protein
MDTGRRTLSVLHGRYVHMGKGAKNGKWRSTNKIVETAREEACEHYVRFLTLNLNLNLNLKF